jgi:hypothetical protein
MCDRVLPSTQRIVCDRQQTCTQARTYTHHATVHAASQPSRHTATRRGAQRLHTDAPASSLPAPTRRLPLLTDCCTRTPPPKSTSSCSSRGGKTVASFHSSGWPAASHAFQPGLSATTYGKPTHKKARTVSASASHCHGPAASQRLLPSPALGPRARPPQPTTQTCAASPFPPHTPPHPQPRPPSPPLQ